MCTLHETRNCLNFAEIFLFPLCAVCIFYYDTASNSSSTFHSSLAKSIIQIATCKHKRAEFSARSIERLWPCDFSYSQRSSRFKVTRSQRGGVKSEKRTQANIFSEFVCIRSRRPGTQFPLFKEPEEIPADRNGELAKPNMYFAAALITFAAKTPTVNERRPTKADEKREGLYARSRSRPPRNFSFPLFVFLFQKRGITLCVHVQVHLPPEKRCDPNAKRTVWFF